MRIHSMHHGQLEIQYREARDRLANRMSQGWERQFADVAQIESWKGGLQEESRKLGEPLENYFRGRAVGQKFLMAAGIVPLGLGAFSLATQGITGGGLVLAGLGLGLFLKGQRGVEECAQEIAGLGWERAQTVLALEQLAARKIAALQAPPPKPEPAPAPAQADPARSSPVDTGTGVIDPAKSAPVAAAPAA